MTSRGVLYLALSAFAFSVMSMLVKLASAELPVGELVLARAVVTLALSYAMVKHAGLSPWGTRRRALLARGLLGFTALTFYYLALVSLPIADATTLQYAQPLITAVLAWWLLGERVGYATGFAIGCGLGGVMLVARGDLHAGWGASFALTSAALSSLAYVTVRQLARTEHPFVIVFYFPLVATPLAIPWAAAHFVWPSPVGWLLLIGIGITTQLGQVLFTMGLAIERAGRATSVGYLQICFAVFWQLVVFGQPPGFSTLAGAALIIAGTLAVSATTSR